jgi:hypothetical protein
MIMFVSYASLGNKEIEVLNFKPLLRESLSLVGTPKKFHPKMLSDPSCKNKYRTTAVATRLDDKTILVVWDPTEELNIKNLVKCGVLTLEWDKQSDVFNIPPKKVTWLEADEPLIFPEFACLI